MSELLYFLQTVLIGTSVFAVFRHHPRLVRIQIIMWTVGVAGIAWRFGLVGQLDFYSNDQQYYVAVVERLLREGTFVSEAFSFEGSRLPYTGPALILAFMGIDPALALKTISLIALLILTTDVMKKYDETDLPRQFRVLFFTGCGGIGLFFSMLALRETMMMMFVVHYTTARSPASRVLSLMLIALLRPHLAVALVIGECVTALWRWLSRREGISHVGLIGFVGLCSVIGSSLYNLQSDLVRGGDTFQRGILGVSQVTRVASNFVGLQFLTVPEGTVKFSLASLLVLRVVLSETILIPLGFTIACLILANRTKTQHLFALSAFTIYVSVVTNTDFNSFRQNIPLMPLLGFAILDMLRTRQVELSESARKSSGNASMGLNSSAGPKGQIEPTSTS